VDATAKEINIKRSLKKFFLEGLMSTSPILAPVYFDFLFDVPEDIHGTKVDKWVVFVLGELQFETLSTLTGYLYLFTRKDREGDEITRLTDTVYELFEDTQANTGSYAIPLYDTEVTPWAEIGKLQAAQIIDVHGVQSGKDKTKFRTLNVTFRWGAAV